MIVRDFSTSAICYPFANGEISQQQPFRWRSVSSITIMLNQPNPYTSIRPSWTYSFVTGALTVTAAVFGMYLAKCGVVDAVGFTILLFGLFMPAVPQILLGVPAIVLCVALCVRQNVIKLINKRISMPGFVWVALGLAMGMTYGWNTPLYGCALKT
ncbi:hypothetical protein KY495_13465 [Massilia sp. PAMC28688]|uniref:hypothetical protein n=1 Tax=Massilia sp. PAMC28688 TaxID=2861283 RepID=UPI001C63A10E|nr:hypothetical protein [Massilia sp. PAMC28688]QYF91804.1 hypothetical protein KY495_13465 [Massilia sp. PAMC28688]